MTAPTLPQPQPTGGNPYGITLYPVKGPGGSTYQLQTQEEADWYDMRAASYQQHNAFTNEADLQDLDRLLTLELAIHRWSLWLAQGFDYMYTRIEENALKNNIREYSTEIRQVKASLGIDKVNRDKAKGENFSDYTLNLLARAKEFGYMRNEQYEKAVTLMWRLRSFVKTYYRCDEAERAELDLSPEKILEWINADMLGDWDALAAAHRKNQAIWVKELR